MKTANVATAKNSLSRLLRRVRRGETVVITDRNRPVARLLPLALDGPPGDAELATLYEAGVLCPPVQRAWDVEAFLAAAPAVAPLPADQSLAAAVLAEREELP